MQGECCNSSSHSQTLTDTRFLISHGLRCLVASAKFQSQEVNHTIPAGHAGLRLRWKPCPQQLVLDLVEDNLCARRNLAQGPVHT